MHIIPLFLTLVAVQAYTIIKTGSGTDTNRRIFLSSTSSTLLLPTLLPLPVSASGGATAGGVYLLSAKQRYNERVTTGITAFLALDVTNKRSLTSFFGKSKKEDSPWSNFSAAGYLLANAFRTSSSTPPDRLPAVKKYKAFASIAESLQKSNDPKQTYELAKNSLRDYVDAIELNIIIK